jgi:glycosyltransferase involved in cell wall biosynthesis
MKIALIISDHREVWREYEQAMPHFDAAAEALLEGFAKMPDLEVHVVSCAQKPLKSPEKLADNIRFHGLYVPKLGWAKTSYQGCARTTRRRLKQIRPDIVHGLGTERECAVSAAFSKFPNVVTLHGNMTEQARLFKPSLGTLGWLAGQLETIVLKKTRGVFCNSAYTESLAKPRAARTWRVPHAMRESFLAPSRSESPRGKCVLLNIGTISARNRQLELLAAAQRLHAQGLEFELQFVGRANAEDPYVKKFLEQLADAAAKGFARHLGFKSTAEILACYDAAHGVVHCPSEEAFGLVALEAFARNVKFFGSRVGGIAEITDGVPGAELFDADDWGALTNALATWIRAGHPSAPRATAGLDLLYHPSVVAKRHVEIYRGALTSPA